MRHFYFSLFAISFLGQLVANDVWVKGEYLGWFTKKIPLSHPFVTSGSFEDPLPGALGQRHTKILIGNETLPTKWRNGFSVEAGCWCFPQCGSGLQASYFFLPNISQTKNAYTSGEPGSLNLAVPVFDVTGVFGLNGIPGETIFILPGSIGATPGFEGLFHLNATSKLQGAELAYCFFIGESCCFEMDGSIGVEWIQLNESLLFEGTSHTAVNSPFASNFFNFQDRFKTDNNFVGGTLAFHTAFKKWNWALEADFKIGLGATNERLSIQGVSQTATGNLFFTTVGSRSILLPGGVFAQPTNIGTYNSHIFATTIEAHVGLAYQIACFLELSVGYSFFWINRVIRPAHQMDRAINSTLTALADESRATVGTGPGPIPFGEPGPAPTPTGCPHPSARFRHCHNQCDFWAQGLTAGLSIAF